jgi:hypothetical protein
VNVNAGTAVSVTVAAGATQRKASAPIGLGPMFAGRRFRVWIVGVLPGWVVESEANNVVATLLDGNVATPAYPFTARLTVCEPLGESETCCDAGVVGAAVAVGFALGATLEPPPPPPPPQADKTTLTVARRAKKQLSECERIPAYYRPPGTKS